MTRAVLAALVSLTLAGPVRAQDTADDAKKAAALEEARQHVAKAKVHYDLGEFKEAADEYIIVYRLRPIPAILFNVAQAYRQAGIYEKARQFYKSYLRESPEAKNRVTIEQSIKEMDDLLAKEKRAKEAKPVGVAQPADTGLPLAAQKPPPPSKVEAKAAEQKPAAVAQKPAPVETAPAKVAPVVAAAPDKPVTVAIATPPKQPVPTAVTHKEPPSPAVEESDPLYKKWWLWTAVGVVAIGAGAAAMSMGGNAAPGSHFGTHTVFP